MQAAIMSSNWTPGGTGYNKKSSSAPLAQATAMAVSFTSSILTSRGALWKEIQSFMGSGNSANTQAQIYTATKNGKCDVVMRKLKQDGTLVNEQVLTVNADDNIVSASSISNRDSNSSASSSGAYHSGRSLGWDMGDDKRRSKMGYIRNKVKKRLTPSLYDWSQDSSDSDTETITNFDMSEPNPWDNGDDDLYDMPKPGSFMPEARRGSLWCRMATAKSPKSRSSSSTLRSKFSMSSGGQNSASSGASSITIQEAQETPECTAFDAAEPVFDPESLSNSDQMSISDTASIYSVSTQSSTHTSYSTNNDFMEYERQLRENEARRSLNLAPPSRARHIPSRRPIGAAGPTTTTTTTNKYHPHHNPYYYSSATDTESTMSAVAPSLAKSDYTADSSEAEASEAMSLADDATDDGASDVGTLDGSSIVVFADDMSVDMASGLRPRNRVPATARRY